MSCILLMILVHYMGDRLMKPMYRFDLGFYARVEEDSWLGKYVRLRELIFSQQHYWQVTVCLAYFDHLKGYFTCTRHANEGMRCPCLYNILSKLHLFSDLCLSNAAAIRDRALSMPPRARNILAESLRNSTRERHASHLSSFLLPRSTLTRDCTNQLSMSVIHSATPES
jgi:hypothetical protein